MALVTGSSSGLGKASAKALAREGVDAATNDRGESRLQDAVTEMREVATSDVVGQSGDITDPEDVAALVGRTVEESGRFDHLVTSAGCPPTFAPLEPGDEDWYGAFDLLVMSVVRTVREATPHLRADGGAPSSTSFRKPSRRGPRRTSCRVRSG
ncbi:MAG: SDR family NAD(P)-dependent oxidoreductase [Haloarculaceae archaeon]